MITGTSVAENLADDVTRYFAPAGGARRYETESNVQGKVFTSYTWANMFVRVTANTYTTGNTVIRSRVGGVNGNMSVTIAFGATGVFEDTVNSDAIVSGNLVNWQAVTQVNAFQSLSVSIIGSTMADTGTNQTLAMGDGNDNTATAFGVTGFGFIDGEVTPTNGWVATETNCQYTLRRATTFSNLRVLVRFNNLNTGTTVVTFRINAANGNQTVSIGSGVSGAFEDTTNTDAVAVADEVNYQIVVSGTSGQISTALIQMAHTSVGREMLTCNGNTVSTTNDNYNVPEGTDQIQTTELSTQKTARAAFTAKNLLVNIISHGASQGVDYFLRLNTANSALTLNVPQNTTGLFEDTTNSVSIAAADVYNYFKDHGAGAGGITLTIIGMEQGPTDVIGDLPMGRLNVLLRL